MHACIFRRDLYQSPAATSTATPVAVPFRAPGAMPLPEETRQPQRRLVDCMTPRERLHYVANVLKTDVRIAL
jgi:hypothetical protein